jgi:hypothetical protein
LIANGAHPDIELSRSTAAITPSAISLKNASAPARFPRSRLLQYGRRRRSFLSNRSSSHRTMTPSNPGVFFQAFQSRDRARDVETGLWWVPSPSHLVKACDFNDIR